MDLIFHQIGLSENVLNYYHRQLNCGYAIGQHIKSKYQPISPVNVLAPPHFNFDININFQTGGKVNYLLAQESLSGYLLNIAGTQNKTVIFETYNKKADPVLSKLCTNRFYYQNEVYFFLEGQHNIIIEIQKIIKHARFYPFIGVILKNNLNISSLVEVDVSERVFNDLTNEIEKVILGVFDEESFVLIDLQKSRE